jgi:hypothetical protein
MATDPAEWLVARSQIATQEEALNHLHQEQSNPLPR